MREIHLNHGQTALVDDGDYEILNELGGWYAFRAGKKKSYGWYAARNHQPPHGERRITMFMHSFLMKAKGIDHRNGNKLDNRRGNLRKATNAQNLGNCKIRIDNTSGFKGVSYDSNSQSWVAYIGGKPRVYLGYYRTNVAAALAYNKAALIRYGKFAKVNTV